MTSGVDPGALGIYGFHNRVDYSYQPMRITDATAVKVPRVWDILSQHGKRVIVLGVPQTYPVTPVNGCLVADFLAPDTSVDYTYPTSLKGEIEARFGEYILDVPAFRTDDKESLLKNIYKMMHNRFDVAHYLMASKPWDFFMMVEMGIDRIHHAFWGFCDPEHPSFDPAGPYRHAIRDYYQAVDTRVGALIEQAAPNTAILVVSDHGARRMEGGFRINQWLINEGYLTLRNPALYERSETSRRIEQSDIDWSKTQAWAAGGYHGRVFLNVAGREPHGTVAPACYQSTLCALIQKLEAVPIPGNRTLHNKVFAPNDLYALSNGHPPDLLIYFGDLSWRAIGTVAGNSIYISCNDLGPDDANHAQHGIFIMHSGPEQTMEQRAGLTLLDVAPTLLDLLGIQPPRQMQGRSIR